MFLIKKYPHPLFPFFSIVIYFLHLMKYNWFNIIKLYDERQRDEHRRKIEKKKKRIESVIINQKQSLNERKTLPSSSLSLSLSFSLVISLYFICVYMYIALTSQTQTDFRSQIEIPDRFNIVVNNATARPTSTTP